MRGTPLISTRVPPGDADVDVLAGGAHPGPDPARAPDEPAADLGHFGHLVGRAHVGTGDGLDERHAQAVGDVGPQVADVADLAAGVLLEAELDDRRCAGPCRGSSR
jgi:hypothetical protein